MEENISRALMGRAEQRPPTACSGASRDGLARRAVAGRGALSDRGESEMENALCTALPTERAPPEERRPAGTFCLEADEPTRSGRDERQAEPASRIDCARLSFRRMRQCTNEEGSRQDDRWIVYQYTIRVVCSRSDSGCPFPGPSRWRPSVAPSRADRHESRRSAAAPTHTARTPLHRQQQRVCRRQ